MAMTVVVAVTTTVSAWIIRDVIKQIFVARQAFVSQSASSTLNLLITALARDALTMIGLAWAMIARDPLMSAMALVATPRVSSASAGSTAA